MTISQCITNASSRLSQVEIPTARLDAELLIAHVLQKSRSWLIANGDVEIDTKTASQVNRLLARRLAREPIAYILGHKEFYGREFLVTPDVLIPRPETETLIDVLRHLTPPLPFPPPLAKGQSFGKLLDVGCGSGCVGITAKLELPKLDVTLSDISEPALAVARHNAEKLRATVRCVHSDLLMAFSSKIHPPAGGPKSKIYYDFVVANLPYVDRAWETSPELRHEPDIALYADEQGLKLIKTLLAQAPGVLAPGGYLLLEADPVQHEAIVSVATLYDFTKVETKNYIVVLRRA